MRKFNVLNRISGVIFAAILMVFAACAGPTLVTKDNKADLSIKLLVSGARAAGTSTSDSSDGRLLIVTGASELTIQLNSTTGGKNLTQTTNLTPTDTFAVASFSGVPLDSYTISAQLIDLTLNEVVFQGSTSAVIDSSSSSITLNLVPIASSSNSLTSVTASASPGMTNVTVSNKGYQTIYIPNNGPVSIKRIDSGTVPNSYTMYVQNSVGATVFQQANYSPNKVCNVQGPAYVTFYDGVGYPNNTVSLYAYSGSLVSQITVSGTGGATTVSLTGKLVMQASIVPASLSSTPLNWTVVNGTGSASINSSTLELSGLTLGTVTVRATSSDSGAVFGQTVITVIPPDFYVDATNGSDSTNDGLTVSTAFRTITKALSFATAGTTIYVQPGTYSAGESFQSSTPLNIPAGVTLMGNQAGKGATTIIQGIGKPTAGNSTLVYTANNVRISGFKIVNQDVSTNNPVGIFVAGSGVTIDNNTIEGNDYAGVYASSASASNLTIRDNIVQNNRQRGLYIGVSTTVVQNNTIVNNDIGVSLTGNSADLGGGALSSTGGNTLINRSWNVWATSYTLSAKNNSWNPLPPAAIFLTTGSVDSSFGAITSSSSTLYVSPSGSDSNSGSAANPYRTITKAVTGALPGTVINVLPGTYASSAGEVFPIQVPNGVSLIGDEPNKGVGGTATEISGDAYTVNGLTTTSSAVDLGYGATIAGFRIVNTLINPVTYAYGVRILGSGTVVRNSTILGVDNSKSIAIVVNDASNGSILNNSLSTSFIGLLFTGNTGTNNLVQANSITGNIRGVEFDGSSAADLGGGTRSGTGGNTFKNTTLDFYAAGAVPGSTMAKFNMWSSYTTTTMSSSFNAEKILLQGTSSLDRTSGSLAP